MPPAGGTFALLKSFLPLKCGIQTTFVDISDLPAVEAAITSRTKVHLSLSTAAVLHQDRLVLTPVKPATLRDSLCRWCTQRLSQTQRLLWQTCQPLQTLLTVR